MYENDDLYDYFELNDICLEEWEETAHNSLDYCHIGDMLETLYFRYDLVMDWCGTEEKETYKPVGDYFNRIFPTKEDLHTFLYDRIVPDVDAKEVMDMYGTYCLVSAPEVTRRLKKNEPLSF